MKSWVLAVGLLAAAFVPAASAADMGGDRESYSDPRYPPPAYNDRDDDDDYGPPPARRYSGPAYGGCVQSEQVRQRLSARGWHDFHAGQPHGDVVSLRARRPSGRLFELTLHRCSGELVAARPLEPRPFGPFAFNRPPREYYDARPPYRDRWDDDAYRGPRWWQRGY